MIMIEHPFYNYNYESIQKKSHKFGGFAMKRPWLAVLLIFTSCVLAAVGWIGLLNLADCVSAVRAYRDSPAELRAAADAAVLPAADPAFTGSDEYTEQEQADAQAAYYASIGGGPLDIEPLEPIIGDFVSFIPSTLPAQAPAISGASSESTQTFIVNTSSGVFHRVGCYHIDQMSSENRSTITVSRAEAAALYTPCKDCNP